MNINNKVIKSLIIGSAVSLASCSGTNESNHKAANENPITVSVSTPSGSANESISLSGRVEAVQSASISTRMMGYITNVYVKTGDKVQKGQMLFSINNADILAKRSQADAAVTQADAAYKSAKKDFERYTALFQQQSASAKELDNITLRYESAASALEVAKQMRAEVNAQLSYANVTAPFSGVVTQKFMDAGNMASPGMPVLALETDATLQVTASVPETQIAQLKLGAEANLIVNAANETLKGHISEISSSSSNSGGLYIIKITPADAAHKKLMVGMYVNVDIPSSDSSVAPGTSDRIMVPVASIIHKGELDGIYTVSSAGQALLRWVRLGKAANNQVELLSGLAKSEKFIVHADGNLYNGAAVKIAE